VVVARVAWRVDEFEPAPAEPEPQAVLGHQHPLGGDRQQLAVELAVERLA